MTDDTPPAAARIRRVPARAILLAALLGAGAVPDAGAEVVLAGEAVAFDARLRPSFTAAQKKSTAAATRAGLERWAATSEGQAILRRALERDCVVFVEEDPAQGSLGRAPQPGLTTLLAARDRKVVKRYGMILNPSIAEQYHGDAAPGLGQPRTEEDAMALAWAAEMLHIAFYAAGVALPHHERPDFRARWDAVAAELGFHGVTHGD